MIQLVVNRLWDFLWIIILLASIFAVIMLKTKVKKKDIFISEENDKKDTVISKKNHHYLFFASIAGSVGLGNIFVVIDSLQQCGPGVVIWLWIGAGLGRYLKFWEIFFSLDKAQNVNGEKFTGGMVYVKDAFPNKLGKILSLIFIIFLAMYSIEIYQFSSLVKITSNTFIFYYPELLNGVFKGIAQKISNYLNAKIIIDALIAVFFLSLLFFWRNRDKFLKSITFFMKIFLLGYFSLFFYLLIKNIQYLPTIIKEIFVSFFQMENGLFHKIKAITAGISTAIYSCDIAIGYEGNMQKYAEVKKKDYLKYCYNIIKTNIIDVAVCTTSVLIVLLYCKGKSLNYSNYSSLEIVTQIFSSLYLGYLIFGILIFCAAFTTVSTYLQAGNITFSYLMNNKGLRSYTYLFNCFAFVIFFISVYYPLDILKAVMLLSAGFLVLINCFALVTLVYKKFYCIQK